MAKTNYNFKTDRYESYEEKIAELESIFGIVATPFRPGVGSSSLARTLR